MSNLLLAQFILLFLTNTARSQRVVIVGAGASGIAAFSRLYKHNITDILVLEAEDRIGGRINTYQFADSLVELGAEWVHGIKGNIVYKLARPYNILDHSLLNLKLQASTLPEYNETLNDELYEIHSSVWDEDGNKTAALGISLGDYYIEMYTKVCKEKYGKDKKTLRQALYAMSFFEMECANTIGSNSWFDVSAYNNYRRCEGDVDINWKTGGYKTILDILLQRFPKAAGLEELPLKKHLRLSSEVKNIVYKFNKRNPFGITVTTTDGAEYHADYIIFTPSLGVLKYQYNSLFTPQLPKFKRQAIYTLGYGTVTKAVMHFPERWWPTKDFSGFGLVWTEETKSLMKDFPLGPSENGKSWILGIMGFYPIPNNPNVLNARISGTLAEDIELISDDIILEGVMYVLERFFGHKYPIGRPDKFIRTFWHTNTHFRGSYSYETVSSIVLQTDGQLELSQPLTNEANRPVCLFAGEATHPYYYSTVHGAIESGFREADRIIKLNTKRNFAIYS